MVYMEFAEKVRSLKDEFDLAVSIFLTDYRDLKERARIELNGLFNERDYPTLASARSRRSDPLPRASRARGIRQLRRRERVSSVRRYPRLNHRDRGQARHHHQAPRRHESADGTGCL